jgi:imidazolonepropionase-like amidohydrolase
VRSLLKQASGATAAARPIVAVLLGVLVLGCGENPVGPFADDFPDEPAPDPPPSVIVFRGVHVVPMTEPSVLRDRTVIIRDGAIAEIGPAAIVAVPAGAFVIDGRGRYLMPGLTDMHVHLTSVTFEYLRNDFMLWLANGVTTVRVMWGSTGILAERQRIEDGIVLGPALLVASPGLDAPGGTWTGTTPPVESPADARARVVQHHAAGYDFIKVYNDLTPAMYAAIVDEAAARGIPVVGHVPGRVGLAAVIDAGQLTLEHLLGFRLAAATPPTGGSLDMSRVRGLADRARSGSSWFTPTTVVDVLSRDNVAAIRNGAGIAHVSPGMRGFFENGFHNGLGAGTAERERLNHAAIIRELHERGVGLLVGTDAGFGWMLPGYTIHEELEHFLRSGLSRYEVLRAATAAPAESIGATGRFGVVADGARADLVLVPRNPLDDLTVLRDPSGVMVHGRWLSRGTLARRLREIRIGYGNF